MAESKESPSNNPGLQATPDEATKDYFMQQTMLRIKDPKASLDFYSRILGMSLLKRLDSPQMKFSIYFMGYEDTTSAPSDPVDRTVWTLSKRATIELTHYWGTESDPEFKGYHNGNTDPRGFVISALQKAISAQHNSTVVAVTPLECENQTIWHIGITVDDTCKACERFEKLGVEFVMKPGEGKMKGLAFIKDPDGYWIEIFDLTTIRDVCAGAA